MSKFATVKAIVDGKEVVIENVVGIEERIGHVETFYSVCGSFHGTSWMCPNCEKKYKETGVKKYCGIEYPVHVDTTRTITISTSITVDKIIEVKGGFNGIKWEAA